ncbi:MAG: DUF3667 domain-containing protein [Chitinophagales bacterium]
MTKHCLNCGHTVNSKYCPQCGQATDTGRLNWKSFNAEFLHALTHVEKSILGTSWQLIKNPGKVMDEYFAGKRKKYQTPIGFFLVWVTISILTHQAILSRSGFHPVYLKGLTFSNPESIRVFIKQGEWLYILTYPLSAAMFYFVIARPHYTYIETIVITLYTFSTVYLFFTLCYIIGGGLFSLNVLHWKFYLFQIILSLVFSTWVCISLFKKKKVKWLIFRIITYLVVGGFIILKFLEFLSNIWVQLEKLSGS